MTRLNLFGSKATFYLTWYSQIYDMSDYVASTPNPLKVLQYLVRSMDIEIQHNNKGL